MSATPSLPPDSPLPDDRPDIVSDATETLAASMAKSLIACPDELLAEIFSYGCAGPEDYVDSQILRSNPERARAPFIVAAVCQRWRAIMLSHSALWHYLTIPDPMGEEPVLEWLPGYVDTVLDRSRDAPIDIIIHFLQISLETAAVMEPIFVALERHAHRWRRFAVVMYGVPAVTRVLAMLTKRTPNLRTLELARQSYSEEDTFTIDEDSADAEDTHDDTMPRGKVFLPDIPILRSISLINVPQVIRKWPTGAVPKAKFYTLEILQPVMSIPSWDMFARQYADAEWLLLGALAVEHPKEAPRLDFPNLDMLWIHQNVYEVLARHSHVLVTPVLREFVLIGGRFSTLTTWLHRIRTHLRNIDLRRLEKFDQADLDALVILERLEVIQISGMQVPIQLLCYLSQDGAQTEADMNKPSRIIWPRLNLFELYSAQVQSEERELTLQLTKMARMRVQDGPLDQHGVASWVKLKFAFIGWCNIVQSQVDMMLGIGVEVRVD